MAYPAGPTRSRMLSPRWLMLFGAVCFVFIYFFMLSSAIHPKPNNDGGRGDEKAARAWEARAKPVSREVTSDNNKPKIDIVKVKEMVIKGGDKPAGDDAAAKPNPEKQPAEEPKKEEPPKVEAPVVKPEIKDPPRVEEPARIAEPPRQEPPRADPRLEQPQQELPRFDQPRQELPRIDPTRLDPRKDPRPEFDPRAEMERARADLERQRADFERPREEFERPRHEFERPHGEMERPRGDFERPRHDIDRRREEFERQRQEFERPNMERPDLEPPRIHTPQRDDMLNRDPRDRFGEEGPVMRPDQVLGENPPQENPRAMPQRASRTPRPNSNANLSPDGPYNGVVNASDAHCWVPRASFVDRCGPRFFVLGPFKGGTTSVYSYLAHHPGVDVLRSPTPTQRRMVRIKETCFFDTDAMGLDADPGSLTRMNNGLQKYFDAFPVIVPGQHLITGEASPNYIFNPPAPGRLLKAFPEGRLILMAREPIDRAYSQLNHFIGLASKLPDEEVATIFDNVVNRELAKVKDCLVEYETHQEYPRLHRCWQSTSIMPRRGLDAGRDQQRRDRDHNSEQAMAAQQQRNAVMEREREARDEMRNRMAEMQARMPNEHRTLLAAIMQDEDEEEQALLQLTQDLLEDYEELVAAQQERNETGAGRALLQDREPPASVMQPNGGKQQGRGRATMQPVNRFEARAVQLRLLERGLYYFQLVHWHKFFPREQLLVVNCDEFYADTANSMDKITAHIGLAPFDWSSVVGQKYNVARPKEGNRNEIGMLPEKSKISKHPIHPETRRELEAFFQPYNDMLSEYTGEKFWTYATTQH